MKRLLADINIQGLLDILVGAMQAEPWKPFWDHLELQYLHFADIGLVPESTDVVVWQTCQQQGIYLITDNRNQDDQDSLEATIRTQNRPTSLPVFTIGDAQRLRNSREYTSEVIETLLIYLLEEDNIRGTGRLFLP